MISGIVLAMDQMCFQISAASFWHRKGCDFLSLTILCNIKCFRTHKEMVKKLRSSLSFRVRLQTVKQEVVNVVEDGFG